MNRRKFLKHAAMFGAGCCVLPYGCLFSKASLRKKVIVLGIDGMDTHLTRVYMHQGLMPNFSRLMKAGSFVSVRTSEPPQSPVAWSDFIVGAPPEVHGIYDFIHRDPATMAPYLSTSAVDPPKRTLRLGQWQMPLTGGGVRQLRQGRPFWEYLTQHDIPATLFKIPANFPCQGDGVEMVSGMGTPDIRGGYGSYTLYTTIPEKAGEEKTGGTVMPVVFVGGRARTTLAGPPNTLKKGQPVANVPLTILRDPSHKVVRLSLPDRHLVLKEGEWSEWLPVSFPLAGALYHARGIVKVYVQKVHPHFRMYISPVNMDPSDPLLPVASSERYLDELVAQNGYFYTQGLPDDTKALSEGILNDAEYLHLAEQVLNERIHLLDYHLQRFARQPAGLLFYYISSLDQNTHMFWRVADPEHPLYDTQLRKEFGNTLKQFYTRADQMVGMVLNRYDLNDPDFALFVMSDHGFAPFRRQVNLNAWLHEAGYMELKPGKRSQDPNIYTDVNWAGTGAYNIGINCLYLNQQGRERQGIVPLSKAGQLRKSLAAGLLNLTDPASGQKIVSRVRIVPETEQRQNPHAPDLIVGWNRGYRNAWDSILGSLSPRVFSDNLDKWSGDHCLDPQWVPAILLTNRKITAPEPALHDITATLLAEFGLSVPPSMQGKPLYQPG